MRTRRSPHTHLALSFAVTTLVALVWLLIIARRPGAPLSFFLLCCVIGATGGATSSFVRQYPALHALDPAALDALELDRRAVLLAWVAPLVGGIFAGLLYIMFAAQILQGALFPLFQTGADFRGADALFAALQPAQDADALKALVWSFVAGWSERLIPNIIETVSLKLTPRQPPP